MIFNLFKSELNFKEHPDILNYLIVEEAEQQWNYHFKEGLTKKAFAKRISLFIGNSRI